MRQAALAVADREFLFTVPKRRGHVVGMMSSGRGGDRLEVG
jgi:hypothetical protein